MNNHATSLWPVLLAGCLLLLLAGSLHAAPTEQQWQTMNRELVQQHILPRYQALQDSSNKLATSTRALCQKPTAASLIEARTGFHNTMIAWQNVQHIQFGPIETLMRNHSMQFWPDKKNLIGKQLNRLLLEQDPTTLELDYLYRASIGVKGLPALERLLLSDTSEFADNSYRCQLSNAVANYIAVNSKATLDEWYEYYAESIYTAGDDESIYESHQEAAVDMMKSLVEPIEAIRDLKILRPLSAWVKEGKEGTIKPRRLESWRSKRSLDNIQQNIESLKQLYSGTEHSLKSILEQQGAGQQAEAISKQITVVEAQLHSVPSPLINTLEQASTAEEFKILSDELKVLHIQLLEAMQTVDIQLGFNSRDGD